MKMPGVKQLRLLERATAKYQESLPLASTYLRGRGIDLFTAELWRLGVVSQPEPGHEAMIGRLCIPYVNRLGVIAHKFRCMADHDCKTENCAKYLGLLGQEAYLFNVVATDDCGSTIHITEGELDAIVLTSVLGEPVVGVPGADAWRPYTPWHFRGYDSVFVWADGDRAGKNFARAVKDSVGTAEIVAMPNGHDVNSLYLEVGAEGIRKLCGVDEESLLEAV